MLGLRTASSTEKIPQKRTSEEAGAQRSFLLRDNILLKELQKLRGDSTEARKSFLA
jgi:hypothetical protein